MHVGIAYLRWRGKRSRHSRRMRTRNFAYLARGPLQRQFSLLVLDQTDLNLAGSALLCVLKNWSRRVKLTRNGNRSAQVRPKTAWWRNISWEVNHFQHSWLYRCRRHLFSNRVMNHFKYGCSILLGVWTLITCSIQMPRNDIIFKYIFMFSKYSACKALTQWGRVTHICHHWFRYWFVGAKPFSEPILGYCFFEP